MPVEGHPGGSEKVDKLLCDCYDRSRANNVGTFHVSLVSWHPIIGIPEVNRSDFVEQVQNAWPEFLKKGAVKLPFEPWILGRGVTKTCSNF